MGLLWNRSTNQAQPAWITVGITQEKRGLNTESDPRWGLFGSGLWSSGFVGF